MPLSSDVNKLFELALSHVSAKAIQIAIELELDRILEEHNSLSIKELAEIVNFDSSGLKKLLDILEVNEIVHIDEDLNIKPTKYTGLLKYLDSPHLALNYKTIDNFYEACKFNKEVFTKSYETNFYDYLQKNQLLEKFRIWCTNSTKLWLPSILSVYDFSSYQSLVDIGGGEGYLLGIILNEYQDLTAILFDQEGVIQGADKVLKEYNVQERVSKVAGDFFDINTLPQGKDLYIVCRTLLNWPDKEACQIINNCSQVMRPDSKLVIIDFYLPEKNHPHYKRALLSDTALFTTFKSANRTLMEWKNLVNDTNLTITNIYTSKENADPEPFMPFCAIELSK